MSSFFSLIFVSVIGLMLGNYATTAFHRIPTRKAINGYNSWQGKKPHCSSCGHLLKFYEYLPLLSWFSTKFKCNYCQARIDYIYTALEIFGLLTAIAFYLMIGINFSYIFLLLNWVCFALILSLFLRYKRLYYQAVLLQLLLIGLWLIWNMLK